MKLKALIPLLMILLAFSVNAEFSAQKGFDWLISKGVNGNYNNDLTTTVFATLAYKDSGLNSEAQKGLAWIKSQEDLTSHCFPKGSCRVKDTALSYLVLNSFGEQASSTESWLKNALSSATTGGNWWLQVATDNNGTCKISYIKNNVSKEKTITINKGEFEGCAGSQPKTFFDLNTCIEPGLLSSNPLFEFDVDCTNIGSSIISVIFNTGNTYRIIQEASSTKAKITINNGCYGVTSKAACNSEVSAYANWALYKADSSINVLPWLQNNYNSNDVSQVALLAYTTTDDSSLNELKTKQKADKSFGDAYQTAISVLALKQRGNIEELGNALDWLKSKQGVDGSWNSNIPHTAAALYAGFSSDGAIAPSGGSLGGSSCFDGVRNQGEEDVDCGGPCAPCGLSICGDGVCSVDEDTNSCPKDCASQSNVCVINSKCEIDFGENSQNCQADCFCGDGTCDTTEDPTCSDCAGSAESAVCGNDIVESFEQCDGSADTACPGQCQSDCTCNLEDKGSSAWLIIIIIVLLAMAIGVFVMKKMKGNKSMPQDTRKPFTPFSSQMEGAKQPQSQPKAQSFRLASPQQPKKTKIEEELDRSLAEAKKLLKK